MIKLKNNKTLLDTIKDNFKIVRKNVLVNSYIYGGKYTQKNKRDAYIEYLESIISYNIQGGK